LDGVVSTGSAVVQPLVVTSPIAKEQAMCVLVPFRV